MWDFIVLSLLIIFIINNMRKPKGYPPGPTWLPLVGCYLYLKKLHSKEKYLHLAGWALHKIYGPVVGLKLGFDRVVLVSGYDGMKEVCYCESFDGRPDGLFFRLRSLGERLGIVFIDGPFRQEQTKFTMNLLRKLGFGFSPMHDLIVREAQEFTNIIEAKHKEPIQINHLLDVHLLNVLWTMVAGYRFSADDQRLLELLKLVHKAFQMSEASGGVINQLPFLKYIAPKLSGYSDLKSFVDKMLTFLRDIVEKHNPSDKRNFISIYQEKIRKNEGIEGTSFTRNQLLILLLDLFMAGTETTSNSLVFIVYYLLQNPEVQKKVHAELDRELGGDEIPTMDHRNRLIYLEATIMEIQRISSLVPTTLPHRAICDTQLMGYNIPKNTILLLSIWSVHMKNSFWKDPQQFRPERFIDEKGQLIQSSHFLPFGIGRRKCLGEILAKSSLFIFTAIILKKFELKSPVNAPPVDVIDGLTMSLTPFKVQFIPRYTLS